MFDIAHNPDKAAHLAARAGARRFPDRRFTFVMAIGESKDAAEVIRPFLALRRHRSCSRRSRSPGRTAIAAAAAGLDRGRARARWGRAITDPVDAFSIARRNADADDDHRRHRLDVRRRRAARVVDGERAVELECLMARVPEARTRSAAEQRRALRVRGRVLPWGERTYVMGIVNVSPDSFSGDGDPHADGRRRRARCSSSPTART